MYRKASRKFHLLKRAAWLSARSAAKSAETIQTSVGLSGEFELPTDRYCGQCGGALVDDSWGGHKVCFTCMDVCADCGDTHGSLVECDCKSIAPYLSAAAG